MDVPEILVGNRSEVRKRVKNALRARKQTLPIDLLGRLEGAGMVPVQAGQRIRFESPVFERSTKSETSEVWLSEFIEALVLTVVDCGLETASSAPATVVAGEQDANYLD